MNNTSSPLKNAQPSCLGCQHEKEPHLTPCNSCCDEMGWRHNYASPAPTNVSCMGCDCATANRCRTWGVPECDSCYPQDPLSVASCECKNYTPAPAPAPKVMDMTKSGQDERADAWHKVWDLCESLGMKHDTSSGLGDVETFIRALAQRAGERYTIPEIKHWLEGGVMRDGNNRLIESGALINLIGELNDSQDGIKAVINKKENHV